MRTLAGCAILAVALTAHAEPTLPTERFVLANGLTVVLAPDPDVATVAMHAWYASGSDDDTRGRPALATHLAFRGSHHLGDGEYERRIEAAGGWTDVTLAADHTSLVAVVPAGALGLVLQLEAERMYGLPEGLRANRFVEARDAIAADRHARATELAVAHALDPARPAALGDGSAIDPEDFTAFWRTHDDPGHATLVIAGRFEPVATRKLIERDFGWIPRAPASSRPVATPAPLAHPVMIELADDIPARKLVIAFRTDRPYAPATAAIGVAAQLLGGKHGLIQQRLRSATDIRTTLVPAADGGRLTIEVVVGQTDATVMRAAVFAAIGDLGQADLAPARAVLDARFVESLENLAFRAEAFARFEAWHGSIAAVRASFGVDRAALAAIAATWLADTAAVTAIVSPR